MKKTDKFATYRNSGQRSSANAVGFPHCIPAQNHHKKEKLMMSTKNSLIAFLFLASPVWSQQQVAATGLQTPHKLILTPTLARVSGPGATALRDRTLCLTLGPGDSERSGQIAGTYIHNPQSASSPIFVTMAADKGVPFIGRLEGFETITPIDPQFLSALMKGTGDATQLGRFTVVHLETVNLLTSTGLASFAFTAANGDILTADSTGKASPTATPGVVSIVETAFISGGTGRFAGATGSFIVTGSIDFATNLTARSFEGTISSPGAKHASEVQATK